MSKNLTKLVLMRVKEIRISLNLTQAEFAKKAGFAYKYYQAVEAGRKGDVRFSTVERMAKACDLEMWELLKFDTKPRPTSVQVRHLRKFATSPLRRDVAKLRKEVERLKEIMGPAPQP